MTITNTWAIVQMDAHSEYEGKPDVVSTVHWTLNGTDGTYVGSVYGSVGVNLSTSGAFTPYADLTKAQVVSWVQDALGDDQVAAYEANVAQQIADQINPPVVVSPLPWSV